MNELRTAKSFRAAADHILRQDVATTAVSRLLARRAAAERVIANDDDAWAMRLDALCALGRWDAVAVFAEAPARLIRARNVEPRTALDGTLAAAVDEARASGVVVQSPARVALADGRPSDAVLVVPLAGVRGLSGHLLAFRVGRAFGAVDAHDAMSIADVAAVEILRAAEAQRDERARRQAFALFEVARLCLFDDRGSDDGSRGAVDVIADALEHDIVQLWLLRQDGSLDLRAARPAEGASEIERPRDDVALRRALDGELVRAGEPSLRTWLSRTARDVIVAPLDDQDANGVLVLGRWRAAYDADDEAIATTCARFIGRALARARVDSGERSGTVWQDLEEEGELAGR